MSSFDIGSGTGRGAERKAAAAHVDQSSRELAGNLPGLVDPRIRSDLLSSDPAVVDRGLVALCQSLKDRQELPAGYLVPLATAAASTYWQHLDQGLEDLALANRRAAARLLELYPATQVVEALLGIYAEQKKPEGKALLLQDIFDQVSKRGAQIPEAALNTICQETAGLDAESLRKMDNHGGLENLLRLLEQIGRRPELLISDGGGQFSTDNALVMLTAKQIELGRS